MKLIWKHCKAWLFTTVIVMLVLIIAAVVVTQNTFLYGTVKTVLGGERRVLVEGDANKYQYYKMDTDEFAQFAPSADIKSKADALKEANNLNELIASEGFVLLKNEGNALPIATTESKENKASAKPKISVFGKNSVNIVYGGSGSGGGDASSNVKLYDALAKAGFDCNPKLKSFYEGSSSGSGRSRNPDMGSQTYGLLTGETPVAKYTDAVKGSYTEYNDAALIVISRIGGEGFDLPRTMLTGSQGSVLEGSAEGDHYLELDLNEKALIDHVTASFEKVIVVVNCATSMELGFIEDNDKIDAAIWIASPGGTGLNALGSILNGNVNPSGRLVDTYARDFTQDPSFRNIGNNNVADGNRYRVGSDKQSAYFVEYEEGIFVGYRYWETRSFQNWFDMAEGADQWDTWYADHVVYPFGYGLSYTDFTWELVSEKTSPAAGSVLNEGAAIKEKTIEVTVKVTNTGNVAGKDVVELYFNAPYDIYSPKHIEKPYIVLAAYEKTGLLQPGASEEVTLSFDVEDMASFDYNDANGNEKSTYELESGIYNLFLGRNAHDAWANKAEGSDNFVPDLSYTVSETAFPDDAAEALFADVSAHISTYLSRAGFEATMPTTPAEADLSVDAAFISSLKYNGEEYDAKYGAGYVQTEMPTTGAEGETKLYDLIQFNEETGEVIVDYDDPKWEDLLDRLTVSDMVNLIGTGNFNTMYIEKIDKPKTTDPDGPAGFTNFMGDPTVYGTCFYASECVVGATFNKDLAHDMGVMVGIEGLFGNVKGDGRPYSGWYAPAVNIHRSPFSGRNWEYYSEDPLLSGKMGANVVKGARSMGVYTYVKHFAVNDQETNRDSNGLITWLNEQAMREIYLKPFEIIVKEGGTLAIMSSFNRIGTTWAGGCYELLTTILREEWGFKGMVITDYNLQSDGYMSPDQFLRAGNDLNLVQGGFPKGTSSATEVWLLRRATKNILYTVAQSNAMNGMGEGNVWTYALPMWVIVMAVVIAAVGVLFAVWGVFAILRAKKKEKAA